jgi:hypothetical protein
VGVVSAPEARLRTFDEIVVHSYALWGELDSVLAEFSHRRVRWMADELAAAFKFDGPARLDGATLLRFGWDLDDAYIRTLNDGTLPPTTVVPFDSFQHIYEQLRTASGITNSPLEDLTATDILISERYWGRLHYQSFDFRVVANVIADLELPAQARRIVFKADPRSVALAEETIAHLAASFDGQLAVELWREAPSYRARLGSLNSLRFHLMTGPSDLGYFFGFDGTDNLVVGATQPKTEILWVPDTVLAQHFSFPSTVEAVQATIAWQRDIVGQVRSGAMNITPPQTDTSTLAKSLDVLDRPDLQDDENGARRASVGRIRLGSSVGLDATAGIETIVERVDALRRDRIAAELRALRLEAFTARAEQLLEAPGADSAELAARLERLHADRITSGDYLRASAALLGTPEGEPAELLERLTNLVHDRTEWELAARRAYGELAVAEFRAHERYTYLRASAELLGAPDGEPAELLERLTNLAHDRIEWERQARAALAKQRNLLWPFIVPMRWLAARWARPSATIAEAR